MIKKRITIIIQIGLILFTCNKSLIANEELGNDSKRYRNFIKINPILLVNGDIPLYFERKLSPSLSLEIAPGITTRNYMFEPVFHLLFQDNINVNFSRVAPYSLGYSLKVSLRLYFKNGSGFYGEMGYNYRQYRLKIYEKEREFRHNVFDSHKSWPEVYHFHDGTLQAGYQYILENQQTIDFYTGFGAGLRILNLTSELKTRYGENYTYFDERIVLLVPRVLFGLKLGFGW